jgi:hypothetical protein
VIGAPGGDPDPVSLKPFKEAIRLAPDCAAVHAALDRYMETLEAEEEPVTGAAA